MRLLLRIALESFLIAGLLYPSLFAKNPERLCLVSCDPANARQDDEHPPLKRGE